MSASKRPDAKEMRRILDRLKDGDSFATVARDSGYRRCTLSKYVREFRAAAPQAAE